MGSDLGQTLRDDITFDSTSIPVAPPLCPRPSTPPFYTGGPLRFPTRTPTPTWVPGPSTGVGTDLKPVSTKRNLDDPAPVSTSPAPVVSQVLVGVESRVYPLFSVITDLLIDGLGSPWTSRRPRSALVRPWDRGGSFGDGRVRGRGKETSDGGEDEVGGGGRTPTLGGGVFTSPRPLEWTPVSGSSRNLDER